jgi:hypothetical protein
MPQFFGPKIFQTRFFSRLNFVWPEIFGPENFKARFFPDDQTFPGKTFCAPAEESPSVACFFELVFFIHAVKNFAILKKMCRIFSGFKISQPDFFGL